MQSKLVSSIIIASVLYSPIHSLMYPKKKKTQKFKKTVS